MTDTNRRRFLRLGGLATVGALAGCQAARQGIDGGTTATTTDATTATTAAVGGRGTPGADRLGGPDDLRSAPTVRATVLDEDQGAGRFVNTPAVVWVEEGATVTWRIEGGSHSVTAYHPDNDRPLRVPEGTDGFDSGVLPAGETVEFAFEEPGVYDYFCRPHEGLGMVGLVVVGEARGGPGTTPPADVGPSSAARSLSRLLEVAGVGTGDGGQSSYAWQDATWDSYWYSLYNMSTTISLSGNGVQFPHNDRQRKAFEQRLPAMLGNADVAKPPVKNPNLNVAAFTGGDPKFAQQPVLDAGDGRPDASTLTWKSYSGVVSPSSLAWTHLKGVTWAKNFEAHFETLPTELAPKFRSQVLSTLAQLGVRAGLLAGGPAGNGALTKGESLELVSGFRPAEGELVDGTSRPHHHAAMLWFLSDLVSLATGGWFGYENPGPLVPAAKLQQLADGVARTTMELFPPGAVVSDADARVAGELLAALGWYGTHAGGEEMVGRAAEYADGLATALDARTGGNGRVEDGAANQAATQGAVGQGLLWASQVDGVDRAGLAETVLGYLFDALWDDDAGTFATGTGDDTYTITARDAGDVTGGVNAADAVLGMDGVRETYARYFDGTVNRGRLQRAERPPSRDEAAEHTLPLPPEAGGEFGQAAVYNAEVAYDAAADEWSVTDDSFDTEGALYLANQEIWISQWGGEFFQGRGVPGESDAPP